MSWSSIAAKVRPPEHLTWLCAEGVPAASGAVGECLVWGDSARPDSLS